ncbi:flavin monoamine oxidase family protein [Gordonia iterans]
MTGTQVVVVGAGMSGLVAARDLTRAGLDVVVVEAADRVGGRMLTCTSALGSRLDLGGQWIGAGHRRFADLADELGTTRFQMHTPKTPVIVDRSGQVLPIASPTVLAAGAAVLAAESAARLPFPTTGTVRSAIERLPSAGARRLLEAMIEVATTGDPDRLSMDGLTGVISALGGLNSMLRTRGGAQDSLIVEGAGELPERLAAQLTRDRPDRIRLDTRVTAIADDGEGVTVETTTGSIRAARVVVTVPAPMLDGVEFTPPLPDEQQAAIGATAMGSVYKAIAVYPDPFWRKETSATGGHAEFVLLDAPGVATFDSSSPDGPGHLCLLVGGPDARALDDLTPQARRDLLLNRLVPLLGEQVAAPVDWHEKSWHLDAIAGGGYTTLPEPGSRAGHVPLPHAPAGRIHWAGTERTSTKPGYIEGAIASGERVADEVISSLSASE